MGRGRGRRRRHRRNGIQSFPYWSIPFSESGSRRYSQAHPDRPDPSSQPIPATTASLSIPATKHPAGIPGRPTVLYQSGYGSAMVHGPAPTAVYSMEPSHMEYTMPPNRMLEPNRQGEQSRMLWHQTGRRFGVPGIPAGQPGWAGAGGVAQIPHPSRGMRRSPDRTFGPGLSAGQGGVQTFGGRGGGPAAVQTYGSLGYASMGDGSMDMAVRTRGSIRRYSGSPKSLKKTKSIKRAARLARKRK